MINLLDLVLIPLAYLYIFGIIFLSSYWKRQDKIDGQLARKIVHLGIGILVIAAPLLFSSNMIPTLIGLSFIAFTFLTSPISPIHRLRLSAFSDGHDLGTVYYSFSLTALLYLYFEQGWLIQIGFLPLVFGDAFANIVGIRFGNNKWPGTNKSVEGSIAGMLATTLILIVTLTFYRVLNYFPGDFNHILLLAVVSGVVMVLAELISPYGLDNLSIPFFCTITAIYLHQVLIIEQCSLLLC